MKHHSEQLHTPGMAGQTQGVVIRKNPDSCLVYSAGDHLLCTLAPRKKEHHGSVSAGDLAVGDVVYLRPAGSGQGVIVGAEPRTSLLRRRSATPMPTARAHEQVIAANVDQAVPVFAAANPAPTWNMLDRYLVSAEASELPALIVLTKVDLLYQAGAEAEAQVRQALDDYQRIGYRVAAVSAFSGEGVDTLHQELQGRSSVLLGKSGVGKTTLLNALQPGLGLRVQEVSSKTGKGKHTTTSSEWFPLEDGGAIIDTPGVREFGLWDVDQDDLAWFFPEMRPFLGGCKFGLDCGHDEEPGCAVRQAVMAGSISPRRWQSYLRLKEDA